MFSLIRRHYVECFQLHRVRRRSFSSISYSPAPLRWVLSVTLGKAPVFFHLFLILQRRYVRCFSVTFGWALDVRILSSSVFLRRLSPVPVPRRRMILKRLCSAESSTRLQQPLVSLQRAARVEKKRPHFHLQPHIANLWHLGKSASLSKSQAFLKPTKRDVKLTGACVAGAGERPASNPIK